MDYLSRSLSLSLCVCVCMYVCVEVVGYERTVSTSSNTRDHFFIGNVSVLHHLHYYHIYICTCVYIQDRNGCMFRDVLETCLECSPFIIVIIIIIISPSWYLTHTHTYIHTYILVNYICPVSMIRNFCASLETFRTSHLYLTSHTHTQSNNKNDNNGS